MSNSFTPAADLVIPISRRKFPWLNAGLFVLTCASTLIVGALLAGAFDGALPDDLAEALRQILATPSLLWMGAPFSVTLMTILMAHEMGHYLTCRYYGIKASLPYFIPAPTIFGTMGAFIRIRSPIPTRSALLEVGVAGPIAGFVVAVPALLMALTRSRFIEADPSSGFIGFGEPIIFKLAALLMGRTPPEGMDISMHPVAVAAWFGFFATALNLLPVGQLDGGHICYALFRNHHKSISQGLVLTLAPLGIFYWQGWLIWAALLLFIGMRHPVTVDDSAPLGRRQIRLGWIGLILFVLCFTPIPFYVG